MTERPPLGGVGRSPAAITRREYLLIRALVAGAAPFAAIEAVASTAIEHPEWDPSETRTWAEWDADYPAALAWPEAP